MILVFFFLATTIVKGQINLPRQFAFLKNTVGQTRLVLTDHISTKVAYPTQSGTFEFVGVFVGSTYHLELSHPVLHFEPVVVEAADRVKKSDSETIVTPYLSDPLYGKGARLKKKHG